MIELFTLDLLNAICTDVFAVNCDYVLSVAAENTCWFIFFQHDIFTVNEDFNRIFVVNVERSPKLDRKYDSSEFIDLSYNTSSFHGGCSPFLNDIRYENSFLIATNAFTRLTSALKLLWLSAMN